MAVCGGANLFLNGHPDSVQFITFDIGLGPSVTERPWESFVPKTRQFSSASFYTTANPIYITHALLSSSQSFIIQPYFLVRFFKYIGSPICLAVNTIFITDDALKPQAFEIKEWLG